ncbi:MAG TPA: lactonase family protein [Stellaceae bacterium]|nr:lactonase family protein [Stellaceae bacterium]
MAQGNAPQTMVYVSNAGDKDIYCLSMNRETGELTMREKVAVPGSEKTTPTSLPMTTSRDKKFLYAQLRSEPYPVSAFAIDRATGKLTHAGLTPLVDQMAYINTDNSGKYLLGASYVGAKLGIYPIDPKTGLVGAKATQILDTKPKAHCVYVGAGNHVYVPVLGGDEILQFKFDAASGKLTPNDPPSIATKAGAGPRHFTIHPNGRWGYLITETTATIGAYNVDPSTGQLTEIGFVDTNDYKEQPAASDIHVTPDGKYLYGAERKTSMLCGFKIDQAKGTLSPIGRFPTEKTPRGFNIDPRGKFLLAVGMDSASMTVSAIGADGKLDPVKQYPMGKNPNWVEIVDLA